MGKLTEAPGMHKHGPAIGIVGAGPAGLTLAQLLKERGVTSVVVFERSDRVGGKSLTHVVDGLAHELGTSYTTLSYGHVNRWLAEFDIGKIRLPRHTFLRTDGTLTSLDRYVLGSARARASWQLLRYVGAWLGFWFRERTGSGGPAFDADMARSFKDWLAARDLGVLERAAFKAIAGMGYGPTAEVPALYGLRWCTPSLLLTARLNAVYEPVLGWSVLWQRMAEQLDVRLAESIQRAERNGPGFVVATDRGEHHLDHLVITTPLDECSWIELPPAAASIARSISWNHFVSTLVSVTGWFTEDTRTFEGNIPRSRDERRGHILSARRTADKVPGLRRDRPILYLTYQYGNPEWPDDLLIERLRADIMADGGQLTEVLMQKRWRYSPQLAADAIAHGAVTEMEKLQGEGNLWFSGATFAHEAVDSITNFNVRLADQLAARVRSQPPPAPGLLRRLWHEW